MPTIKDTLDFLAELHFNALHDSRNPQLTPAERKDAQLLAQTFSAAWAFLHSKVFPEFISSHTSGKIPDAPDLQLIHLSFSQLKAIVLVASLRCSADDTIHLYTTNGMLSVFALKHSTPHKPATGITIHHSPSI